MYGIEARNVFNESLAPEEHQNLVMGHSIRWYSEECENKVDFPDIDWNLKFDDESCLNCISGDWEQETGFTRDMVSEIEYIRDYGLRAIYSNWAFQKHHFKDIGWWWLHLSKAQRPEEIEKFKGGVEFLGLEHKNPIPDEWKK